MSDFELIIVTVNNKLQVKHTPDPITGRHANSHLRAGGWFALQRYVKLAKYINIFRWTYRDRDIDI